MKKYLVALSILLFSTGLLAKTDPHADIEPKEPGLETKHSVQSAIADSYDTMGPYIPNPETNVKEGVTPFSDPFQEARLKNNNTSSEDSDSSK